MTWLIPLIGGGLIGAGVVLLMATLGRVAGISGIVAALLPPAPESGRGWRLAFLAGLVAGPPLIAWGSGAVVLAPPVVAGPVMALAGALVGLGTALGSGCTSGHGVCGLARLSLRSLVATLIFMATGVLTVFVTRHII